MQSWLLRDTKTKRKTNHPNLVNTYLIDKTFPDTKFKHIKQKACQFHEPLNKHQSVCFFDVVFLRIPFPRHPIPPCHWDPRENKPTMPTVILFLSQDVDENIDLYGLYTNIYILTVVDSPSIPRVPIAIFWEDRFHRLSNLLKGMESRPSHHSYTS